MLTNTALRLKNPTPTLLRIQQLLKGEKFLLHSISCLSVFIFFYSHTLFHTYPLTAIELSNGTNNKSSRQCK
jgi:hypothetical protein